MGSTRNQLLEYLENRLTKNQQILRDNPHRHSLQHTGMTSLYTSGWKLQRKNCQQSASDGFEWNFSRTVLARITQVYCAKDNRPHQFSSSSSIFVMTSLTASGRLQNDVRQFGHEQLIRAASWSWFESQWSMGDPPTSTPRGTNTRPIGQGEKLVALTT